MPTQKGFVNIALIIVIVILAVAGYLVVKKKDFPLSRFNLDRKTKTANWKTYKNKEYGFEFQYPASLAVATGSTEKSVQFKENGGPAKLVADIFNNPQNESPRIFASKNFNIYDDQVLVKKDILVDSNMALSLKHPDLSGVTYYIFKSGLMIELFLDLGQQTNQQILSTFKFTDQTSDWKTYTNQKYGFQLSLTDAWKGYAVSENNNDIEFGVPSADPKYAKDIMVFVIHVAPLKQWEGKNVDEQKDLIGSYLGKNDSYVYGYEQAQDNYGMPSGVWDSLDRVKSSFKFTK